MPTIGFDSGSLTPAYRQVIEQVRTLIVEGTLAPGFVMPSVRKLATDLGVHFNTVATAYRALASEGWLEVTHGRPARVTAKKLTPDRKHIAEKALFERLRYILAEMRSQGVSLDRISRELRALAKEIEQV